MSTAITVDDASTTDGLGATLLEHIRVRQGFAEGNALESITNRLIIVSKHGREHRTTDALKAVGGKNVVSKGVALEGKKRENRQLPLASC